jgi:YHS domain-containing protein
MKQAISIAALCVFLAACATMAESTGNNPPTGSSIGAGGSGSNSSPAKRVSAPLLKKPHSIDALNNVVTMESDESRTALCICGKTLPVTADTQSITRDGTAFYLCSTDCANMAGKLPAKDWDAATADWKGKFTATKFLSNARMKEGREVATCLCDKIFEVNSRTRAVAENGLVVHCCSAACDEKFRAATPEGRMEAELALLPAAKNETHPSVEVIYRGTGGSWTTKSTSPGSEGK